MIVAIASLGTFAVALLGAALLLGLSRAPGWRDHRILAIAFAAAAVYALTEFGATTPLPVATQRVIAQLSIVSAAGHALAWSWFFRRRAGRSRFDPVAAGLAGGIAVLVALPGLVFLPVLTIRPVLLTATNYQELQQGPLAPVAFGALMLLHGWLPLRALAVLRQGEPAARVHALAFAGVALAGGLDWLGLNGLHPGPNVVNLAVLGLVASTGAQAVLRLVSDSRRRERLAGELDDEVRARAEALARAESHVARAARLQALGEVAAGVAEEIDAPARRIEASIAALKATRLSEGRRPLVRDARRDVARIAVLTRELVAASHAASRASTVEPIVPVAAMARASIEGLRAELPPGTSLRLDVAEELVAAADGDLVQPVLSGLLARAARSVARRQTSGTITIRAVRSGEQVLIEVGDDGPAEAGPDGSAGKRAPTTAKGLGLPASIGLLRAVGGELELVRADEHGTLIALRLPVPR